MATEKRFISLDEALDATHREVFWTESEAAAVRSFLVRQPKVDAAEVVHGHWGIYRENEISKTVYCTHCWKEFYIRKKGELQLDMMPYCPNCGAKMDGGSADES